MTRIRTLPITALLATLLALLMGAATVAAAAPAKATAPFCGIHWGSQPDNRRGMIPDSGGPEGPGTINDIRAGRHPCFDRLVIDIGRLPAVTVNYDVRYVQQVRHFDSGEVVPVAGGATLQVVFGAHPVDRDGMSTYTPDDPRQLVPVAGWRTFRQVAWAGDDANNSKVALGVRARLPFRTFVLSGGGPGDTARLVIDVAHRW